VSNRNLTIAALALATALGGAGVATLPLQQAAAQAANPAQPPARPAPPMRPRASHIDGRIAYMKAELKITPAQEAQWDKVAQVLRQNETERRTAFEQVRANRKPPENALQHLEGEARFAAMRAQQADRFLAAFRPLYDSLSATQKKSADDLLGPHRHFRRRV
jgi:periplasmic protein CpxP/Spy